jgi:hypothetical protein
MATVTGKTPLRKKTAKRRTEKTPPKMRMAAEIVRHSSQTLESNSTPKHKAGLELSPKGLSMKRTQR